LGEVLNFTLTEVLRYTHIFNVMNAGMLTTLNWGDDEKRDGEKKDGEEVRDGGKQ
jgi:hypothetical protein